MNEPEILAALDAADASLRSAHESIDVARQLVGGAPPVPGVRYPHAITDLTVRTKPALPTIGSAGSVFTDPSFGTPIVRVTDANTGNGASCRVASNAHLADWSADGRALYVLSDAGNFVFRVDPATRTIKRAARLDPWRTTAMRRRRADRPGVQFSAFAPVADPYSQGEPCWSRTDPDALYTVGGPETRTIRRWSLASDTFTDVLTLDTLVPGINLSDPRTYVGGIISGGGDSLVVFFGGASQDQHYLVTVLRPGQTPVVVNTRERLGISLHSATIDLSGRFVMLYSTSTDIDAGHPKQLVWDTTRPLDDAAAFHAITVCPWGHDALGFGRQVNQDTSGKQPYDGRQWQLRALDDLDHPEELINPQPTPPEIYVSDHTSWNCDQPNALQPVLSALYRDDNPTRPSAPWGAWDDEIVAIATDGSGTVFRFAHHRSNVRDEHDDERTDFWSQPMPNVSPSGDFLMFTSNMERTLGRDSSGALRQDVFIVALT